MKVVPAVYRFEEVEPFKFSKWGWNLLTEVAEILEIEREQVMSNYIALSYDTATLAATDDGVRVYWYEISSGRMPVYVSAGWVKDVFRARFDEGIHQVIRIPHKHGLDFTVCPEGTIPWAPCVFLEGTRMYARVGLNREGQPYWTYDACQHEHGTQRVADLEKGKIVQRDLCRRCGTAVGGER